MTESKGFLYKGRYFLLPAPIESTEKLENMMALGGQIVLKVTELKENGCVAPDFTIDCMETISLTVNPGERIFPATVYIWGREEYNKCMENVLKSGCLNCKRCIENGKCFTDPVNIVDRHGYCPYRITDEGDNPDIDFVNWNPSFGIDDFWELFATEEASLRKMLDDGKIFNATKAVAEMITGSGYIQYLLPCLSKCDIGGKTRYVLMLSGAGSPGGELLAEHFVKYMPEEAGKLWDVYPYAVKGLFTNESILTGIDTEADPPVLRYTYLENMDLFALQVFVDNEEENVQEIPNYFSWIFEKEKALGPEDVSGTRACAYYLHLCHEIGEEKLLGATLEIGFFPKNELIYDGNCCTPAEFSDIIDEKIVNKEKLNRNGFKLRYVSIEGMNERRTVTGMVTFSENLSYSFLMEDDPIEEIIHSTGMSFGTLFYPSEKITNGDMRFLTEHILDNYGQSVCFVDAMQGTDGLFLDFLILDRCEFLAEFRNIRPVTEKFGGRLFVSGRETEL